MLKTRFAPSPTGNLTLGNMRTALFCVLLAKSQQGTFLLRIEDTDQSRSAYEYVAQLKADLFWLGLDWQEGPDIGGNYGPYFQSQRLSIYQTYYEKLEQNNLVYPCFCSDQELAIARKLQLSQGKPPRYSGICAKLTEAEITEKKAQGLQPALRFRVPDKQKIEFVDFVRGPQNFLSQDIGDFIIRRADGSAAFFFCNAIDDALMGVSHVLRGDDHLTNTPRQLLLLQALQLPVPQYGHIPLILGDDGSPLSKRHGSRSIKELRETGYLSSALQNYLARLGHHYLNNNFLSLKELAAEFSLTSLGHSPSHYDPAQLLYWQKQAVQHLDKEAFWLWLGDAAQRSIPLEQKEKFIDALRGNIVFPEDAIHWASILFSNEIKYSEEAKRLLHATNKEFFLEAAKFIKESGIDLKLISQHLQQTCNVRGKQLFQPLRMALTGTLEGPELVHVLELLGTDRVIQRLLNISNG